MPHIAMVIPSLAGGGAERTALRVAGGLAARGHRVDIVLFAPHVAYPLEVPEAARLIVLSGRRAWARRNPSAMPAGAEWRPERAPLLQGVGLAAGLVRDFPAAAPVLLRRAALGRALRLARYAARERPDILFANLPRRNMRPSTPPASPARAPSRLSFRSCAACESPGTQASSQRRRMLFPAAAHVAAISRGVAENIVAVVGVPANGTDLGHLQPGLHCRTSLRQRGGGTGPSLVRGRRTAGDPWASGRLAYRQKDFPTLIEAFRACWRSALPAADPRRRADAARARKPGARARPGGHVSLPGWAENPYAFMARAALFVLSSRHEGFGNVLVEALACGCPAVSTDCPAGPAEILEDPALLAPVGDPEALAQVMLRALARPADRPALRAKAARFSMERAVEGYEAVVERVLRGAGRGGRIGGLVTPPAHPQCRCGA